jgi:ABC-2 type transport system ATP-binding protein
MDEAEQLCDEIAIMDKGKIIVQDTPENLLKQNFDGILIRLPKESIKDIQDFPFKITEQEEHIEFSTSDVEHAMNQLLKKQVSLEGVQVKSPNLEDLFLKLTGHALRG